MINVKSEYLNFLLVIVLIVVVVTVLGMERPAAGSSTDEFTWTDSFHRPDNNEVGNGWSELRGDWVIAGNALQTNDGPEERVIAQTDIELGKTFDIEATLRNTGYSRWNGVAFNISDNGDGTQNYYALRMVTYADERPATWQLLKVTRSIINDQSLIDHGTIPVEVDRDYTVRVSSSSYGMFDVAVFDGETELLDRKVFVPLNELFAGGYAGFYSLNGHLQADEIHLTTSAMPAEPPTPPLSPGPLECHPVKEKGVSYQLPDEQETVVDKTVVDTTWAGHQVGQSLLTDGDDQYVAYYDANRQMVIAHRTVDDDTWVRQPLDEFIGWDSHNYVTIETDRAGHLHVSGNMHNDPLVYFRTTSPGDVTTLTRITEMVDPETEQEVTYPVFLRNADGDLIFRYRDGWSGDGNEFYNIYDEETQEWQRLLDQPLHDGEGQRNAYVAGPTLGPDGYYHITWVWRETPDAATNHHLSYARSRDLVHWEKSDGTPLTLPITYSTGEVIDPVPMNGGIINGNTKIGFDAQGRVLISYHKYDEHGNTQVYIARHMNKDWQIKQVSDWEGQWTIGGLGSLIFEVKVDPVSVLPDGNLRLDFDCHGVPRTWILHPNSLRPIAEIDRPQLPSELSDVRSDFPEMEVRLSDDRGYSGDEQERYVLRWESLPQNQDQPRNPPLPDPGPLEVYFLRR